MAKDYYAELGVNRGASADDIKRAYRKLASQYHPDRNQGDQAAEAKFKLINRAHDVLSDTKKRSLYDQFGEVGLREGFNPDMVRGYGRGKNPFGGGGAGLEDLFGGGGNGGGFSDLFGDVFRSGRGRARGQDAVADVEVDFVSAIRGASVVVRIPGAPDGVTVRVPKGAGSGDKLRVAGHGTPGQNGGPAGDLLLNIKVQPHPFFEREGLDLKLDVPIALGEAVYGGKVRVPTPSGDVTVKVPAGAQSGKTVRLKAKGVARQNRVGDLFLRFLIAAPQAALPELEAAIAAVDGATDLSERDKIEF